MLIMNDEQKQRMGDEAPGWKEMILVLAVTGLLIVLSWIAWFKFGWFH